MKTHTAHTPTPWNVERPFQEPGVYIAGPNTGLIAKLYEPDANLYNGDKLVSIGGNSARIVACVNACEGIADPGAVPDLLAALKAILATFHKNNVPLPAYLRRDEEQARAAIARATGEKGGK
jgi:hypothetical protein